MQRWKKIIPKGTRDLLFDDCAGKRRIIQILSGIFESRGYCEVITPSIEFYDVFAGQHQLLPQEDMYKLTDNRGRLLVLRPDCTTPIARVCATRLKDSPLPVRLYYNQNVFYSFSQLNGRSDEVSQSGVELIGAKGIKSDLEIIETAVTALQASSIGKCKIELGDVGFFKALADEIPFTDEDRESLRSFIESKNHSALLALLEDYKQYEKPCKALAELPRLFGGREIFAQAVPFAINDSSREILSYLAELFEKLSQLGLSDIISIDLGLVHHISYYTGLVFRGYTEGSGETVLSGGRYDALLESFGYDQPATGFAIDVDAVAAAVRKSGAVTTSTPTCLVYYENGCASKAFGYLNELAATGTILEMSVFDSLEETLNCAKNKGIEKVVFISQKDNKEFDIGKERGV